MAIQAHMCSENFGLPRMENHGNCGFDESYFNLQQKQQQQLQHMQQVSALKSNTSNNNNKNENGCNLIHSMVEKQRQEIDQFISLQNERLRLVLEEQRKQQLATLLHKIEAKTIALLKQKDEEIAKAANRTMELENFLRKLEMENQAWQRLANENEALVMSLNNEIEQLQENHVCSGFFNNNAEDAQSCCEEATATETGVNRVGFVEEQRTRMLCKSCNSRNLCVLFLPCRHLCSCQSCEAFLDYCPICTMVKKGSIEVIF